MAKIKVTPAELLTQAGEMESLEKEYEAMFSKVSSVLGTTNQNWSQNLANNFSGKIDSAQKGFSNVTGMLRQGASAAKASARSFESVDSSLAKVVSGGDVSGHIGGIVRDMDKRSNAVLMASSFKGMNAPCAFSADPVNLSNGNFVYEKEYLQIDSSLPMSFRMFYNSNSDRNSVLGRGWLHNFEIDLIRKSGQIVIRRDDGSEQMFFDDDGVYTCVSATFGQLTRDSHGYRFVDEHQIVWTFDPDGHLIGQENMAGDRLILAYDWEDRLSKVTNEVGDSLTFSYDTLGVLCRVEDHSGRGIDLQMEGGKVVAVTDGDGATMSYAYNEKGLLTEIVNGRGIKTLVNEYDEEDRTVAQTFADGGVMSYVYHEDRSVDMVQQNGSVITYHHDGLMRNLKMVYPNGEEIFTYNDHNQRTSFTDRRGNTSFYDYDAQGNLLTFTNARRDVMTMTYNAKGQILSTSINGKVQYTAQYDEVGRLQAMTDGLGGETRYEYDDKGQVIGWIQPDGSRQNYTYDEYGHVKTVTNAMGGQTTYEYDALHRVVKTIDAMGYATTYDYDEEGRIVSTTDAMGYVRTYEYDGSGNVISYKDGNDAVIRTTYTVMNKPETVTDPDGNTSRYEYDLMWNLTRMVHADGGEEQFTYDESGNLIAAVDQEGGETHLIYDANGNMIQRIDPEGGVHKIAYDELNRPVEITDPCGRVARAEFDVHGGEACVIHPDGSRTEQTFDVLGRVVTRVDRCGYKETFAYDAMGQVVEIADALGWKERKEYYPGGLLKSVCQRDGMATYYEYDENERIVALTNESGGRWTLEYDVLGRPTALCADGKLLEGYEYDAEGNVLAQIDGAGNRTTYRYSAGGNLIAMVDATGYETTYEYDGNNRVIKVIQPESMIRDVAEVHVQNRQLRETLFRRDLRGLVVEEVDPEGNRQTYTYDKCGREISRVDADGHRVDTEYYADGLAKVYNISDGRSVLMQYDALKQLIQLEDALGITRIVRDEKTGLPTQVINPQDETISYEWEVDGRRKSMTYPDGKKQIFSYDEIGRLSEVALDGETVRYEYDQAGRLVRKSSLAGETRYAFDKLGYTTRMTHLHQDQILEDYVFAYAYPGKKSGVIRQSSQAEWSGEYSYRYDARGSLTGVLKDGVEIESYRYDDFGNRTHSLVHGQTSHYSYNRLNQLISMVDEEGTHGYSYDCRGNMVAETLNGRTVLQMEFDATGMLSHAQSSKGTAQYTYNGFGQRYEETIVVSDNTVQRRFGYDITKDNRNMLFMSSADDVTDLFWDNEIIGVAEKGQMSYFMNDALSNPVRRIKHDEIKACQYTAFGCHMIADGAGSDDWYGQSFVGYVVDPITGLYHSPRREYSPKAGQFISTDSLIGHLSIPLAFHAYHYCMGEPINAWDPTGAVFAWLAGGVVGAVAKTAAKLAGDVAKTVVKSAAATIKNGKLTVKADFSPWQDYVGAAVGGFAEGTVLATTGSFALAGAAGSAAETLTANGLKMATGVEGYRKEDGYTIGSLLGDTAKSAATGAAVGAAGGYLFKNAGKYVKWDGVTVGKGSCMSIFKANITKAARDQIKEMTWKSVGKGLLVYGGVGFVNSTINGTIKEGKKLLDKWLKKKTGEIIGNDNVERIEQGYELWENIDGMRKKATCSATA